MSTLSPVRPKVSFLIKDLLRDTHDTNKMPADTPAVVTTGFPRYCFSPAGYGSSCSGSGDEDFADDKDRTDILHNAHPAKDHRKTRPSFAPYKVARLKSIFVHQNYLSKQERRQLALELNMSDEQVKTWFQNKRTKLNKKMAQCDEHFAKLLYLNDLISGKASEHHHDYQASLAPSCHGYSVDEYPSLGGLPRTHEYSESLRFPYLPKS